jgi:Na+/H+ antiporter NhaD/arsenite permease-like protein
MLDGLSLSRLLGGALDARLVSNFEFLALFLLMMLVMNALELSGLLASLGGRIVNRSGSERRLALFLCLLVFFASALLTNDVVLLGIVPLSIVVGSAAKLDVRRLGIFEGIAANSGSLLTPFGNPQNIFISVHYNVALADFMWTMLPLWLISLGLLAAAVMARFPDRPLRHIHKKDSDRTVAALGVAALAVIILYFGRVLPTVVVAPVVLGLLLSTRRMGSILRLVDWKLYLLFVLMAFGTYAMLRVYTLELSGAGLLLGSIGLSQLVSNVPAAFVLSGAADWRLLAIGVDIGGSGTLISSVATVIAYRFIKRHDPETSVWDFMRWGALFCLAQLALMLPVLFWLGWL